LSARPSPAALRSLGARWYAAAAGDAQDVVVIGGGPGGYVAAIKGAQLGLKVGPGRHLVQMPCEIPVLAVIGCR